VSMPRTASTDVNSLTPRECRSIASCGCTGLPSQRPTTYHGLAGGGDGERVFGERFHVGENERPALRLAERVGRLQQILHMHHHRNEATEGLAPHQCGRPRGLRNQHECPFHSPIMTRIETLSQELRFHRELTAPDSLEARTCGLDAAPMGGGDAAISRNPQMAHTWHTRRNRSRKYMQINVLEFRVLPVLRVRLPPPPLKPPMTSRLWGASS